MATTYWQNTNPQALILPTKEGTSITIPQAGYVKDESGTYYSASFGLTSVSEPSGVTYAYTYTHQVPPPDEVGEPGGTTGQLQYNNAGEFAGLDGSTIGTDGVSIVIGGTGAPTTELNLGDTGIAAISALGGVADEEASVTVTSLASGTTNSVTIHTANGDTSVVSDITLIPGKIELSSTEVDIITSNILLSANFLLRNYVDNAAALADGLVEGQLYHTGGALKVVIPAE